MNLPASESAAASAFVVPDVHFRKQVIVPVAAALAVLVIAFLVTVFYYLRWDEQQKTLDISRHAYQLRDELLERETVELAFLTRRFADTYAAHAGAMRSRDATRLEAIGKTLFAELNRDFEITHGYFIGKDRRVILRMHRPDLAGDEVRRETLSFAALSGEPVTGVEVGRTAIQTLRHVRPWFDKGELIGYIELGKEVDSLMKDIRSILDVEVVSAIHKEYSNAADFDIGKKTFGFIGNWDDHQHLALLASSLASVPAELVSRWQKGDANIFELSSGDRVWSVSLLPLEDIGGRQSVSLALLRDVSAMRDEIRKTMGIGILLVTVLALVLFAILQWRTIRIEEHVLDAYDQLKQSEHDLRIASAQAQAANIAKSQFLSTMSHELRTPLNGILGMAQLLEMDGVDDAERKEYVGHILASGQNLLTLISDVLDLSQLDTGELKLNQMPFDPANLIEETAGLFRDSAREKNMNLDVRWTGPDSSIFVGDPIRLRQMLSGYLGNAIKFSQRGTIRLQADVITPAAEPAGMTLVEFSVSDQGIGIADTERARLFQVFSQVDATQTRRYGGTGLGLYLIRRLAEEMNGTFGVDSQPGEGSRFWFRVPLPGSPDLTAPASADI
jgi:signal transduction histidine kinase